VDYEFDLSIRFDPSSFRGKLNWTVPPESRWLVDKLEEANKSREEFKVYMGKLFESNIHTDTFEKFQIISMIEFGLRTHVDYEEMYVYFIPVEDYERWLETTNNTHSKE
jgi:hypothetical protein